ncbi:hypothetical protein [Nostoc sp. NZL]|nr:hypothetical protein [Nostoc sp. NZL]
MNFAGHAMVEAVMRLCDGHGWYWYQLAAMLRFPALFSRRCSGTS